MPLLSTWLTDTHSSPPFRLPGTAFFGLSIPAISSSRDSIYHVGIDDIDDGGHVNMSGCARGEVYVRKRRDVVVRSHVTRTAVNDIRT